MVTVIGYQKRNSLEGSEYFALELQTDELELVISQNTGRHYATVRKCQMSSTFDETVCKMMIGKVLPGTIVKEKCDPYLFTIPDTGEEVTLDYRNTYIPVESQNTERVVLGNLEPSFA